MKLKTITILIIAFISMSYQAYSQLRVNANQCYSRWENDTLITGNSQIQIKFLKSPGGLNILSFKNVQLGKEVNFASSSTVFKLGDLTKSSTLSSYKAKFIPNSPVKHEHLLVELINSSPNLDVKRQIRIYPGSPMVKLDFSLKSKSGKFDFTPEDGILLDLSVPGNHWKMNAVEFYDRTDKINTLVKEHNLLSFRYPTTLSGNLLFSSNLLDEQTIIILKEAPCSFVQLSYPGYDFKCMLGNISVRGIGLANNELSTKDWTSTYSVVLGISGNSELEKLTVLRSYQQKIRRNIPERDEMIMMNTWGDRNQDASINEAFIKQEIDACEKLNISHLQVDDGWQQGRSHNSANKNGSLWDEWKKEDWQPDSLKFPSGLNAVTEYAKKKGVKLGLWFHPTNENYYATWENDAQIITDLYNNYGIKYFKIDGVKLPNKLAEINFRKFLDMVSENCNYEVVFNLDLTADNRGGYNFLTEYGNLFLENRYTDWGNYYPYWTLRNVWMLSKYIPVQNLQIEFLNPVRNKDKYPAGDIFAPSQIPFDYQFAITMAGQPLAWFEGSNLPKKFYEIASVIEQYQNVKTDFQKGQIFPIGDEPSGRSCTGFQSILDDSSGYFLVYRENNEQPQQTIKTYLKPNKLIKLEKIIGYGNDFSQRTNEKGIITFALPNINQFVLYRYYTD
jgi:hypothetical protein